MKKMRCPSLSKTFKFQGMISPEWYLKTFTNWTVFKIIYVIKTFEHQVLMWHIMKLDLLDVISGLKTTI